MKIIDRHRKYLEDEEIESNENVSVEEETEEGVGGDESGEGGD